MNRKARSDIRSDAVKVQAWLDANPDDPRVVRLRAAAIEAAHAKAEYEEALRRRPLRQRLVEVLLDTDGT